MILCIHVVVQVNPELLYVYFTCTFVNVVAPNTPLFQLTSLTNEDRTWPKCGLSHFFCDQTRTGHVLQLHFQCFRTKLKLPCQRFRETELVNHYHVSCKRYPHSSKQADISFYFNVFSVHKIWSNKTSCVLTLYHSYWSNCLDIRRRSLWR